MASRVQKTSSFIVTNSPEKDGHLADAEDHGLRQSESSVDLLHSSSTARQSRKRGILAIVVLLALVAVSVIEGQFTSIGFTTERYQFDAPFFYTSMRFLFRSFAFPILLTFIWIKALVTKDKRFSAIDFIRKCSILAPGRELTTRNFLKYYTLPTLTSLLTGAGYMVALKFVPPSVTSACFCCTVALSYILTIIFLHGKHVILKTIFVLVSFGGVAMVAYETSAKSVIRSDAYIGVICVLIACASLSAHQFFYSISFPKADSNQCAFVVTVMFAVCFLIYWPVPLTMRLLDSEIWYWSQIPWGYVIGALISSLAYAFLYAFGLSISNPFFMSLSELLNLSISAVVDHFRGIAIGPLQISGSAIIGVAFVVLLVPEEYLSVQIRRRMPQSVVGAGFDLPISRDDDVKEVQINLPDSKSTLA